MFPEASLQALRDFERSAIRSDVLAQTEDVWVALHFLEETLPYGFQVSGLSHREYPSWRDAHAVRLRNEDLRDTRVPGPRKDQRTPHEARPPAQALESARPRRWPHRFLFSPDCRFWRAPPGQP